jgi:hypothetical protein
MEVHTYKFQLPTQETETGGSWFQTSLGKKLTQSYLKNSCSKAPVTHAYNPSCLGGWDWENHDSRLTWTKKKFSSLHLHRKILGVMAQLIPATAGCIKIGGLWSRLAWAKSKTLSPTWARLVRDAAWKTN